MGEAIFPTPFKDIPIMGDKLTYENLDITFIIDEFLENYRSLHEWMTAIGFRKAENTLVILDQISQTISSQPIATPSPERVGRTTPANALFSDANLIVLSNKNNPILQVDYQNMHPVVPKWNTI